MASDPSENRIFQFGTFRVFPHERTLRRDGDPIQLAPKAFDTLVVLLQNRGRLVSKDELMRAIWPDANVEEGNLTLNISQVRKALDDDASDPKYIETVPKSGYRFIAAVRENKGAWSTIDEGTTRRSKKWLLLLLMILACAMVLWVLYIRTGKRPVMVKKEINSPADVAEVKNVVRESQIYETLMLYGNPSIFDREQIKKYWLPADMGGKEISEVESAINRLRIKGQYYGKESKLERFDFTYVRIFSPGTTAEVGTIERWYLPLYQNGSIVPNRNVYFGPYQVDYSLRKADGIWLIEKTTTPRPEKK